MKQKLFFTLLVVLPIIVFANPQNSIQDLNTKQTLLKFNSLINMMVSQAEERIKESKLECLKAFGDNDFCSCVFEKIPIMWSFYDYIQITTRTKDENKYYNLSNNEKEAYDKVISIRNECVKKLK